MLHLFATPHTSGVAYMLKVTDHCLTESQASERLRYLLVNSRILYELTMREICDSTVCILDLLLIVYVLALELHMLMLVSPPVSLLFFLCINICVVQVTGFNERNASLVAFQVLEK